MCLFITLLSVKSDGFNKHTGFMSQYSCRLCLFIYYFLFIKKALNDIAWDSDLNSNVQIKDVGQIQYVTAPNRFYYWDQCKDHLKALRYTINNISGNN